MNVDELETAVYEYTLNVLKECEKAGLKQSAMSCQMGCSGHMRKYRSMPI